MDTRHHRQVEEASGGQFSSGVDTNNYWCPPLVIGRGPLPFGMLVAPAGLSTAPKQILYSEGCSARGEHCFYSGICEGVSFFAIFARIVKGTCFRTVPCPVKIIRKRFCSDGLMQDQCCHPFSMLSWCG